ncbi:MAG: hypothetical protein FVQ80_11160 [Planctomycetes bacterium]|nr:hypothetical protein [Planctomycetota bacterium]
MKCSYNETVECTWVPDHAENCVGGACRDYHHPPRSFASHATKRMDQYKDREYCSVKYCDSGICIGNKCAHYIGDSKYHDR